MDIYAFNTRSNQIEKLQLPEYIGIYTCGPTVYDRVHIGNLKTLFWSDFIATYLESLYPNRVKSIINITDIDDKIIDRLAAKEMSELQLYTNTYTRLFLKDLQKLHITRYENQHHKVSDNIENIIAMILKLKDDGFAYQLSDGSIYFDSSKISVYPFPSFKKENITEHINDRIIIRSDHIRDNKDFILWKVKDEGEVYWSTAEITNGRPGWHIECSAIAHHNLDEVTIHIGGEDLKFPHHTCEILQSESYDNTKVFGKYWFHIGYLNLGGEKMSKSLGNILTIDDIPVNKYLLRYYLFQKSYRKITDFSLEEVETYTTFFINLHKLYNKLSFGTLLFARQNSDKVAVFTNVMQIVANDFNTRDALVELNRYVNYWTTASVSQEDAYHILKELDQIDNVFKIIDKSLLDISLEIKKLIYKRIEYKKEHEFTKADEIRVEINELYIFNDLKDGFSIVKRI